MGSSPDTPKEDPAAIALRKRQAEQLLQLDEESNTKIKRLFAASSGLRVARGSADSRLPARNSTMSPAADNYGLVQSNARGYDDFREANYFLKRAGRPGLQRSGGLKRRSRIPGL